jgi:hypothetical protein
VYLWKSSTYREIWQSLAVKEHALYSRFNFFLESDATYTLDEALKELQDEREFEMLPTDQQRTPNNMEIRRSRGISPRPPSLVGLPASLSVPFLPKYWVIKVYAVRFMASFNCWGGGGGCYFRYGVKTWGQGPNSFSQCNILYPPPPDISMSPMK